MTYEIPRLASVQETADEMRVSVSSVRSGIKSGDIPAIRVGRHYRVPLRALIAKLEGNEPTDEDEAEQDDESAPGKEGAPADSDSTTPEPDEDSEVAL